jgi:diguanylate cyclase (GGDEF)-like protein
MSRTSRARKLSALTTLTHQQSVQHLAGLGLGIRDEKGYVDALQNSGPVHQQTCACGREFFDPMTRSTRKCPVCRGHDSPPAEIAKDPPALALRLGQEEMRKAAIFDVMPLVEQMRRATTFDVKPLLEEMRRAATFDVTPLVEEMRKAAEFDAKPFIDEVKKAATFDVAPVVEQMNRAAGFDMQPLLEEMKKATAFDAKPFVEQLQKAMDVRPFAEQLRKAMDMKPLAEQVRKALVASSVAEQVSKAVEPFARMAAPIARMTAPIARITAPIARMTAPIAKMTAPIARMTAPIAKMTEMYERVNPVQNVIRSGQEMQEWLIPLRVSGRDALETLGVEDMTHDRKTTRSLLTSVNNVEPVWNVTGESGPPFSVETDRTTPHYYVRRAPGTPGGQQVEVNFLGDAERENIKPDGHLPNGKAVFYYTTSTGHLHHLLRDKGRGGCLLLKKDGSVWSLVGIEFFEGREEPARGLLRRVETERARQEPKAQERRKDQKFEILDAPRQLDLDLKEALGVFGVALIYLDIDNFKRVNTTFTERVVDRTILPQFQHLIVDAIGSRGHAYAEGGDEVVLLLPNFSLGMALAFATDLLTMVRSTAFAVESQAVALTMSVGLAVASAPEDLPQLPDRANLAKKHAKEQGRDRVSLWTPEGCRAA